MKIFDTKKLSQKVDEIAKDGSNVRILLRTDNGSMAHFELLPGQISQAITHKTIEEIWYFISGSGEMWRKNQYYEEVVEVKEGVCLTIPVATHFQFRNLSPDPLTAIAVTMPPWSNDDEAVKVTGKWQTPF